MPFVEYNGEVISNKSDASTKTDKTFEKDAGGYKLSTQEDLKDKVGNDWWHGPASLIVAGTIGYGVKAAWDWLKSKETPSNAPRIEPTMGGNPLSPPPPPPSSPPSVESAVPKGWEDIVARSNANAAAKAADAAAKANPVPTGYAPGTPGSNPMDLLTQQPPAPQLIQPKQPIAPAAQAPAVPQAPAPQAPVPQPTLTQTVETGGDVGQALKTDVAKMVDEASGVAPQLSKREQSMKNWLLNQYGAKNYPEHAEQAYEQVKKILGYTPAYPEGSKGGSLLPEEKGKILDWRKESLAGPKVNLSHTMKKALKVGGPALAAMVATTEFANAKTAEDRANAGTNLLGAILPPGMDILSAGAPGVQQQQINQAALLGSPYAQTEWAKTQRLREKAGAGRGMAPPSAYQR